MSRALASLALLALAALSIALAPPVVEAQELRVKRYQALKAAQKWEEALAVAREEVASPAANTGAYLADVRAIAISALADYARRYGVQTGMDAEAERYFRQGRQYSGTDDQRLGQLSATYARYFSDSARFGLAIPHLRDNVKLWQERRNMLMSMVSLTGLASAYKAVGEEALRDHHRAQALAAAAEYFEPGRNRPTPNQWLQYGTVLDHAMDDVASLSAQEIDRLWKIKRPIVDRYFLRKSQSYSRVATMYAAAGAQADAEKLLAEAQGFLPKDLEIADEVLRGLLESDFSLKTGLVRFHARRYPEAIALFEEVTRFRAAKGLELNDIVLSRNLGLAYERTGDLERAAAAFRTGMRMAEGVRQSYSVAERTAFFRSGARRSYHGLIRITARQAAAGGGVDKFWEALQASEMVRARQLGDLIDANAPPLISRERLEAIRGALGASRAVLYYTLAEDHLVILAFTSERHVAVLRPVDPGEFAESIRRLARDLARPESPTAPLEQSLASLGKSLLEPLAELLRSRDELIVLPDGVLNLLPFDLLGAPGDGYRPLLSTHRVRLAPSLRFAGRASPAARPNSLLAVADPRFGQVREIAGVERSELQAVTRGNRYMDYFTPLPETRTEVEAIRKLFPVRKAQLILGEQATRSAVTQAPLGSFSHLHFATHGILGGEVPGVGEPALVLTAERGDDGLLLASEIAALKLDAQLSVLSACNTGSGEYVTGEGVMGLSRAFLIAGSRSVVMSLWPVASKATERLMVMFYGNLGAGQDAHEALRNAKLRFLDEARSAGSIERHPMFWAPFVVFGS